MAYADSYDFQVTAKWAYDGKLEDISSVIDPMRAKFEPAALSTTFLLQQHRRQARAYYAFPIKQQTMHIQYWKDMLADAGFKESDIPTDWKDYWSFWCDKVQPAYRQKTGNRGFGIGMPMGVDSTDSFFSFLTFMDAYNVKLVNDSGKLLVDDPAVRAGPDQRRHRLHRGLRQGLHAAVEHELEGPGQQRRLPQQDDGHDAQRDDLDRREVARRHEQRHAHRGAARDWPRRTTPS